jgi:Protein of unknown function (DUF3300)
MVHRVARQAGLAAAFLAVPLLMMAQEQGPPPVLDQQAQAQQQAPLLAPQQLDDLVAPIALYPDALLSQVLVATTYPLELVEAQQWLQHNSGLTGGKLMDAARQQSWDASVQAMVAFPDVLAKLNQDVQWTTALGNAFLAQQADVMSAVQRMRARAQSNGKLRSTPQETVTTEMQGDQQAIQIAPADPQVIYVPSYDPTYIWGPPAWGYYPPLLYAGYGYGWGPAINIGFCFGGWGGWGWGGWGWGWGPNWFGHSVFVNPVFFNHFGFHGNFAGGFHGGGHVGWAHDASHRLGVSYPNHQLASRFGATSMASRAAMSRSSSFNGARQGFNNGAGQSFNGANRATGSGNWNRFGGSQAGGSQAANMNRGGAVNQGARSAAPQAAGRTNGNWQSFQNAPRNQPNAQSFRGSPYQSQGQRFSAPSQQSQQRFSAPQQRSSAPMQSAPRMSSPSFGGGARSFGGGGSAPRSFGGGGGGRSFGGGGGGHASGGGGHGHR